MRKPVHVMDILNEVIALGLVEYARKYGVSIPKIAPFGEPESVGSEEDEHERVMTVNGRRKRSRDESDSCT